MSSPGIGVIIHLNVGDFFGCFESGFQNRTTSQQDKDHNKILNINLLITYNIDMSLDKWWGKRMSSTWNVWGSDETEKVLVCKSYVRVEGQSGIWIFVFRFAFAFSFVLVKNILDESEQVEVCRTCLAEVGWGWRGSQAAQEKGGPFEFFVFVFIFILWLSLYLYLYFYF